MELQAIEIAISSARQELRNQQTLKAKGKFSYTAEDLAINHDFGGAMCVLAEEVGEVAEALNDHDGSLRSFNHIYEELIQTAAVALSWAAGIEQHCKQKAEEACR